MRLVGVLSTAVLSLTLAAPVYGQEEQHEQQEQKAKPAQDEKKAQPEKPAKQDEKSAQPEKNAKPEEKNAQRQNNSKPEEKNAQQQQAQPAQHAGGNRSGRIPDDRYKANFGREHTFRVTQGDYRNHRFQYGGYWFGFAAPWPSNWLYTQDVFVVDIGGVYYLCNPAYPGVNVELSVAL
ncbi:MAG: hypothetical protein ABSF15_07390 [Candidatus Sulfotelmatobacter sp.]|jgi:hypothetical protein